MPQVRYEYKQHVAETLPRPEGFDATSLDPTARAVLERVYVDLGRFEGWHLREMAHVEDPWTSTEQGKEISLEAIRRYFEPRIRR